MNNVVALKRISLGTSIAELFSSEIMNFDGFKSSIVASVQSFRDSLGYSKCYDKTHSKYEKDQHDKGYSKGYERDC